MRKITFLAILVFSVSVLFAQKRQSENISFNKVDKSSVSINLVNDKAVGDTLMYFDGQYVDVADPADEAIFGVEFEELTGNQLDPTMVGFGFNEGWNPFYELHDVTGDTMYMWASTSWFDPPAQANNWIYFGPVTIPATGAELKWEHLIPDTDYSDGYKVYMSTTGMTYFDFINETPIYTRADNPPNAAQDIVWQDIIVDVPAAFAGQQAYFGFQHDANDMFILYLTRWLVTEAQNVSVKNMSQDVFVSQNYPNPVSTTSVFSYALDNNVDVKVEIYDITGRMLVSETMHKAAGTHTYTINAEELPNGTYFYTFEAGTYRTTKKFVVVK